MSADTGHREAPVCVRYTSMPFPNWSVLETFRWRTTVDTTPLSRWTDTSCRPRLTLALKDLMDGVVNSTHRRNPKNPVHAAAHNIVWSEVMGFLPHSSFSSWSSRGVMGRRVFLFFSWLLIRLIPRITSSTLGVRSCMWSIPTEMRRLRMAPR